MKADREAAKRATNPNALVGVGAGRAGPGAQDGPAGDRLGDPAQGSRQFARETMRRPASASSPIMKPSTASATCAAWWGCPARASTGGASDRHRPPGRGWPAAGRDPGDAALHGTDGAPRAAPARHKHLWRGPPTPDAAGPPTRPPRPAGPVDRHLRRENNRSRSTNGASGLDSLAVATIPTRVADPGATPPTTRQVGGSERGDRRRAQYDDRSETRHVAPSCARTGQGVDRFPRRVEPAPPEFEAARLRR
jgi:hypothetical protein